MSLSKTIAWYCVNPGNCPNMTEKNVDRDIKPHFEQKQRVYVLAHMHLYRHVQPLKIAEDRLYNH